MMKTIILRFVLLIVYSTIFNLLLLGLFALFQQITLEPQHYTLMFWLMGIFIFSVTCLYVWLGLKIFKLNQILALIILAVIQVLIILGSGEIYWFVGHITNVPDVDLAMWLNKTNDVVDSGRVMQLLSIMGITIVLIVRSIGKWVRGDDLKTKQGEES